MSYSDNLERLPELQNLELTTAKIGCAILKSRLTLANKFENIGRRAG